MRIRIFFIVSVLASVFMFQQVKADDLNIKNVRKALVIAIEDNSTTDSLYKSLTKIKEKSGLVNGFIGAVYAIKAKHSWNPYLKLKYLRDSEKIFKKAVAEDPHNMEIRFMRFSIEHYAPSILGFNKELGADSEEIITQLDKKNYGTADKDLVIAIIKFLLHSKRCTPLQNDDLNKHLAAFT